MRPRPLASAALPMGVRSIGHRCIGSSYRMPRQPHRYHQFIWGVSGVGRILIDGHEHTLEPGHVARYQTGDVWWYCAGTPWWEYRWLTLDGPQAATIIASFGLTWKTPRRVGACPDRLFDALAEQVHDVHPASERKAAASAFLLLAEVSGPEHQPRSQVIEDALGLIDREFSNPLFGIATMAARLKVHRSTLARNFAEQVGMTPVEYLASVRVQRALALLKTTTLNIAEIAYQVGFSDPNYFSRNIKQATGLSPSEFRAARHA